MATELTRRRLLAAGGLTVTALTGGYALAARTTESPDGPSGWAMAQRDAAGRSFAPEADPPTDDVSVTWKQRFDTGVGFTHRNSPVVADGRVYALWEQLLVLDADSGAVQFRTERDLSATPAFAGATAYQSPTLAVTDTGGVAGLHAAGGVDLAGNRCGLTRWRRDATDDRTRMLGGTGEPVSPVAADGTVLAPGREALTALDASDGTVRWQREAGRTRPAVRDGIVYTTRFLSGVVGFDIESGERRRDIPLSDRRGR